MGFSKEELQLIEECVSYRRMYYERINYGDFSSPDEKMEGKEKLKQFNSLQTTLRANITKEQKKNNGK